jgi:hypothetical protein
MHRFEQGNTLSKGRPRGSRNKLAKRFFEDMSEVWENPLPMANQREARQPCALCGVSGRASLRSCTRL